MTIAVLGEALIDLIESDNGAYRPHLAGSPYNVAIGLARQGIAVSYLSPLSDDTFGDQLHYSLETENVAVPITRRSLYPTSLCRNGRIPELCSGVNIGVLGDALEFACAAAAINVSRVGCSPPTKDEVDDFIASTRP